MDWFVGLALILLIYAVFVLIRRKQTPADMPPPSQLKRMTALRHYEGRECIFTDGSRALKSQVQQIDAVNDRIRFSLQPLRTQGLSEVVDTTITLSESAATIEQSEDFIQAPYASWRLYFNRDLIHHIQVIAKKGADMKIIQSTILDFRSDQGDLTP